MDYVCEQMSVKEKDYFGLRFVDITRQRVSYLHKLLIENPENYPPHLFLFLLALVGFVQIDIEAS